MEERINQLDLEKKVMLERANTEKRDLTQEEKQRAFQIDEEIYRLKSNPNASPTDFVKTSVKIQVGTPNTHQEQPQQVVSEPVVMQPQQPQQPQQQMYTPPVEPVVLPSEEIKQFKEEMMHAQPVETVQTPIQQQPVMQQQVVEPVITSTPVVEQPQQVVEPVVTPTPVVEQPQQVAEPVITPTPVVEENIPATQPELSEQQPVGIEQSADELNMAPAPAKKKSKLLVILLVLIVIALIVAGIVYFLL